MAVNYEEYVAGLVSFEHCSGIRAARIHPVRKPGACQTPPVLPNRAKSS